MFDVSEIASIPVETLETLIKRDAEAFAAPYDAAHVERLFIEYCEGPGRFEDFRSWRQAWRNFTADRLQDVEDKAKDIGVVNASPTTKSMTAWTANSPATDEAEVLETTTPLIHQGLLTSNQQLSLL